MTRKVLRLIGAVALAVLLASLAVVARQKSGTMTTLVGTTDASGNLNVTAAGATGGQGTTGLLANLVLSNDASGYLKINCQSGCGGGGGGSGTVNTGNVMDVYCNVGGTATTGPCETFNFQYNATQHQLIVNRFLFNAAIGLDGTGFSIPNALIFATGSTTTAPVGTPFLTIGTNTGAGGFTNPAVIGGTYASPRDLTLGGVNQNLVIGGASQSGASQWVLGNGLFQARSAAQIGWSSSNADPLVNSNDTGFCRNAAGVVEINSGTCGSYRDLKIEMLRVGQTTPPTCSANCGTTPSVLGSDTAMTVTLGTGSPTSGFVVTFNHTWATAPACTGMPGTTGTTKYVTSIVTTTTTITVTTAAAPAASDKYHFICVGIS